jgi:hypothetical protein
MRTSHQASVDASVEGQTKEHKRVQSEEKVAREVRQE